MDPYLEGEMWQEFHETLAGEMRAQLMPLLTPKYVALLAKRYVIDRPSLGILDLPSVRVIYPDVHVAHPAREQRLAPASGQAEATLVAAPAVELPSPVAEEVPLLSVEIRDIAQRRLVTIIEILSPANKRGEGAREYAQRREEILSTSTHLLEIDLLRQGQRIPLLGEPPPAPYYVYLSRVQRRPYTQIWPVSLREPLPTVPVPLLPPDPDVPLALQTALQACFELVGYERLLDYAASLPDLNAEDTAWVKETLRTAD